MSKPSRVLPHVYTEFDPPPDPGIDCSVEPSMTQQNFKAECDINTIMARYEDTGLLDDNASVHGVGSFLDVASSVDYHAAQNLIAKANEVFLDLPTKVRRRFNNDPVEFLAFIDDDANLDEARELGLLKPLPVSGAAVDAAAAGASSPPRAAAASPVGSPIAS